MEKLNNFIKNNLLKAVKTITMFGMMLNTYDYAKHVFPDNSISAGIVVVVIDLTAIGLMYNDYLDKRYRIGYIFLLLFLTGLINLKHAESGDMLQTVIAVVSLINLFVLIYIDMFLKKPQKTESETQEKIEELQRKIEEKDKEKRESEDNAKSLEKRMLILMSELEDKNKLLLEMADTLEENKYITETKTFIPDVKTDITEIPEVRKRGRRPKNVN